MTDQAKLAWKTLGLSLLVLLPFAAHLYFSEVVEYRAPAVGAIAELIAQEHYAPAYRQLLQLDLRERPAADRVRIELQRAICERQLKKPDRAYARLHDLPGNLPLLDDYRYFWMARSLEDMGEKRGATAAYEDLLFTSENPILQHSARLHLATLYRAEDQPAKALALYEEQLAQSPDQAPQLLYFLAATSTEQKDAQGAQKWRLKLLEGHPKSRQALKILSALPRSPNAPTAYAAARVRFSHEQFDRAVKGFERFTRAHPRDQRVAEARFMLARSYLAAGNYAAAKKIFGEVYDKYGRPSALYRIGGILVRRNKEDEAIATYERFAKHFPQHALADDALWQVAKALERNNHFDRAEQFYRRLAEDYPESKYRDEAGWSIGFTYYCREEYYKALVVFKRLSRLAREPHIVDQCLYWAGKSAAQLGEEEQSVALYRRAAAGFPRSYYSARAVKLGHLDQVQLKGRPMAIMRPRPEDEARLKGVDYLQRAEALYALGLRQLSGAEMQRATRANKGNRTALKIIRDRYEVLGFLDRALRLSMRIFVDGQEPDELPRIYPDYYWDQIVVAAAEAEVDPFLVLSVIRQESTFNQGAVSRAGAMGLMQIMPHTGHTLADSLGIHRFERHSLFDPAVSIRLGSYFLGDQVRQFTAGPAAAMGFELGLAAYNAGPHNARKWLERFPYEDIDAFVERIPYKETRLYVKLVLKNYAIYKALSNDA
ncbi:MAG: transglycosylase SLT domain-containing protein [Candidatus Latescibacterota bacterium]|nr:transglycosylase SLT domain-containing protein [Candidatus Latescibacterota bacterium]